MHMKRNILIVVMVACTLFSAALRAEQIRQITWDTLIPLHLVSVDPLADFTQDQKDIVYWVINMLESLPPRGPETEEYYQEIDKAMPTLRKAGINIQEVLATRNKIRTTVNEDLNGQRIRMPGYLLPLEVSGANVTEFLLVPYIGACIHVPPPPPNQIVHVKVTKKGGYKTKSLYDPVWVTGVISAKSMVKDLYLVDGSAGVNIGYTMQASQIKPYEMTRQKGRSRTPPTDQRPME